MFLETPEKFEKKDCDKCKSITEKLQYLLPISQNLSEKGAESKKRERMRLVNATKFQGKPMNNIEIAKLEFIIVMYYWKPSTALKHTIRSVSAKTDYTPQIEAFTSVCSEYEYERDVVWISSQEMFRDAGRNTSGNERRAAQGKTTLDQVNLVVDDRSRLM